MKNYFEILLFTLMSLFWALNFLLVKVVVNYENVFYVLFFRILFALLISIILFPKSFVWKSSYKVHIKFFVLSLLNIVIFMEFWFMGEMVESASLSSIIIYSYPILNVLLSIIILNEKITKLNFFGSILGLIGIILIFFEEFTIYTFLGLIFLIISAFGWALGAIFYKKYMSNIELISVNTMQFLYSLPITFLVAIFSGPLVLKNLNLEFFTIVIYMGTLGTSIAMLIYLYFLKKYNVSRISPYLFLVPILSVLLSVLILHEKIAFINYFGILFVIVGIYLSQIKKVN
ncbi:MAG: DMT family transporter [Thermoplasmata archaeon]